MPGESSRSVLRWLRAFSSDSVSMVLFRSLALSLRVSLFLASPLRCLLTEPGSRLADFHGSYQREDSEVHGGAHGFQVKQYS